MRTIDSSESSYGSIRELATEINGSLVSRGHKLNNGIGSSNDVFLCHFLRHYYLNNPKFKRYKTRVLIQPIDGTHIAPFHVDDLNKFDVILTPAQAGKQIMEESGVYKPVIVVPNYYKESDVYNVPKHIYRNLLPQFDNRFMFYHESSLQIRKNTKALLESYLKAFSDTEMVDNVHLVIKGLLGGEDFNNARELMYELKKQYKQIGRAHV